MTHAQLQRDTLIDNFIEECVEAHDLSFGGGVGESLHGYLTAAGKRVSATNEQRESMRAWLTNRGEVTKVAVAPLSDAWHESIIDKGA